MPSRKHSHEHSIMKHLLTLTPLVAPTLLYAQTPAQKKAADTNRVTVLLHVPHAAPPRFFSDSIRPADSLTLKQLAAEQGIDTAKAKLRVVGDSAWVWAPTGPNTSEGVQLIRVYNRWVMDARTYMGAGSQLAAPRKPETLSVKIPRGGVQLTAPKP
jgi:hypothetical protein